MPTVHPVLLQTARTESIDIRYASIILPLVLVPCTYSIYNVYTFTPCFYVLKTLNELLYINSNTTHHKQEKTVHFVHLHLNSINIVHSIEMIKIQLTIIFSRCQITEAQAPFHTEQLDKDLNVIS